MASIAVPEEPNPIFGPIPGYQSPVTNHIRQPTSIRCAPTRKRAQYWKMYSQTVIFSFHDWVPEWPRLASITAVQEPNMSFGPIPGYQSRQTHTSQRPPSIKCSHTRKRAQYRKLDFSSPHHGKNILTRIEVHIMYQSQKFRFPLSQYSLTPKLIQECLLYLELPNGYIWTVCARSKMTASRKNGP